MILKVIIEEQTFPISVPDEVVKSAKDMFKKMNQDMDNGWQMSRVWVDHPTPLQRCQIAADKLLTALHRNKKETIVMMAAYILDTLPGIVAIDIDTTGDMNLTEVVM